MISGAILRRNGDLVQAISPKVLFANDMGIFIPTTVTHLQVVLQCIGGVEHLAQRLAVLRYLNLYIANQTVCVDFPNHKVFTHSLQISSPILNNGEKIISIGIHRSETVHGEGGCGCRLVACPVLHRHGNGIYAVIFLDFRKRLIGNHAALVIHVHCSFQNGGHIHILLTQSGSQNLNIDGSEVCIEETDPQNDILFECSAIRIFPVHSNDRSINLGVDNEFPGCPVFHLVSGIILSGHGNAVLSLAGYLKGSHMVIRIRGYPAGIISGADNICFSIIDEEVGFSYAYRSRNIPGEIGLVAYSIHNIAKADISCGGNRIVNEPCFHFPCILRLPAVLALVPTAVRNGEREVTVQLGICLQHALRRFALQSVLRKFYHCGK